MVYGNYMYAVERDQEYLEHYGVKGMRWGVRRAHALGPGARSERRLARTYKKAERKLNRLKDRADIDKQKKLYQERKDSAIGSAVGGVVGSGMLAGFNHISKQNAIKRATEKAAKNGFGYASYTKYSIPLFAGLTAGDAIANGIAAKVAKNRTTKEGHAKAVRDVQNWQREMNSAFKGTKYAKGKKSSPGRTFDQLSKKEQRQVAEGLNRWANNFENHYQKGLSNGMSHQQAEAYANKKVSGVSSRKRRRNRG